MVTARKTTLHHVKCKFIVLIVLLSSLEIKKKAELNIGSHFIWRKPRPLLYSDA